MKIHKTSVKHKNKKNRYSNFFWRCATFLVTFYGFGIVSTFTHILCVADVKRKLCFGDARRSSLETRNLCLMEIEIKHKNHQALATVRDSLHLADGRRFCESLGIKTLL